MSCSTVKSRIGEHEKEFALYPPEVQAQIQNGNIDEGFTEEMVYMAKGNPAEKETSQKDGKTITLWKYPQPGAVQPPGYPSTSFSSPYSFPTFGPGPIQPAPFPYARANFIVKFVDGKVESWGVGDGIYRPDPSIGKGVTDGLPDK